MCSCAISMEYPGVCWESRWELHTHTCLCRAGSDRHTLPNHYVLQVLFVQLERGSSSQHRVREKLNTIVWLKPVSGSRAPMATAYSKQMLYFWALIWSSGLRPGEQCRADLRTCMVLLLGSSSHRCFRGKSPPRLLWLWLCSSGKWVSFLFWLCFLVKPETLH